MGVDSTPITGRVLIVAGSDSGGGAGIQADIKTVTALGGYAATAVTALTAQNTRGLASVVGLAPAFIAEQMRLVLSDIGADCIKTGMLHTAEVIEAVAGVTEDAAPDVPVVVDPVIVAKRGETLLEASALSALKARFLVQASVVTPNIPEAEALTGRSIGCVDDMIHAGSMLLTLGADAALVKGGHLTGETVTDVLVSRAGVERFEGRRIDTANTHGTGCTFASAIATGLAQQLSLVDAVARAHAYVMEAIRTAPGLGSGYGPLNHCHTVRPFP